MTSTSYQSKSEAVSYAPPAPAGAGAMVVLLGLGLATAAFISAAFFDVRIAVGIFGLLVFALATLRSPYFGLLLYILVLYVRPGEIGLVPEALHFERVVALGLMAVVLLRRLVGQARPLPASPLNRVIFFFLAAVWVGVPFAYWKMGAMMGAVDLSKLCWLYLGIVYLVEDVRHLRTLVWVALLAWAWYGFSAIKGYVGGGSVYVGEGYVTRALGPTSRFGDADTMANLLACALPYVGTLLWVERGRLRLVLIGLGALYIGGVAVTGSRTGLLALAFVVLLLVCTGRRRLLTGSLLLLVMVGTWLALPESLKDRYRTIGDYDSQATWVARRQTWEIGERMFLNNPVFGVGAGNFAAARRDERNPYDREWLSPHSVYIEVSAELGLPGIICFLALIWYVVRENRRLRRQLRRAPPSSDVSYALALSLAAEVTLYTLLFVGITGHNLSNPSYYLVAALTVCLSHFAARAVAPAEKSPATAAA